MRFKEFKDLLEKVDLDAFKGFTPAGMPIMAPASSAGSATGGTAAGGTAASPVAPAAPKKLFVIGDSHAAAVATAGGSDWVNLAIGGRSSTDGQMLANINQIPKGALVLVSQGANDTANAMRASIESRKPPKDPKVIASNVANVVSKVQAQGADVIFLLFPNGPGRGPGLAKYYGGDYQDDVRAAIKSAIDVPIIDINGKPLTDGVHATMGVYREVANQVKAKAGASVKPAGGTAPSPTKPATSDKPTGSFALVVPTDSRGPEVADIQKALIALGYNLPKYGVDGIRGKETTGAIKSFQRNNKLQGNGIPNKETIDRMNQLIKVNNIKLTPSTAADVKGRGGKLVSVGSAEIVPINSHPKIKEARQSADKFLGRNMDDKEWNELVRAVGAEAGNDTKECGYVMAVILNRTRQGYGGGTSVNDILHQRNQFQAVTGTAADGHSPSKWFVQGPSRGKLDMIVDGAIKVLPSAPKDIYRFTAANPAAYGPGTNIGYLHSLQKAGGYRIGDTIFA